MSPVMINELTSVTTHSRCSVSERFHPSSLLKTGSGFCHCRSDCVPTRKVYTCRSAASQTREGTGRTTKAGDARAFQHFLGGVIVTALCRGVYMQMGYSVFFCLLDSHTP